MKSLFSGQYSKMLVAVLGAAMIAAQSYDPSGHWVNLVTAIATAVGVYAVPNLPGGGSK